MIFVDEYTNEETDTEIEIAFLMLIFTHREFWLRNGIGIIGLWKKYILLYE